jgi:threonyl-tRNA synthetase
MIHIELPDGSKKEFPRDITPARVAEAIGPRLRKDAITAEIDGVAADLDTAIHQDSKIKIHTLSSPLGKEVYRHTAAHIMAQAIMRLFPETKLTIGPAVEDGFYYDLDSKHRFTEADFEPIEKEIQKIIKENLPIVRSVVSKNEALKLFADNPFKTEILREIKDERVTLYSQDKFTDLCRGPHLQSTGRVGLIKLMKVAGAYWRGSEKNPMLQRIYAGAFESEKELKAFLEKQAEAEKRDHRKLGKELDLFSIQESIGPGLILWHPNGAALRSVVEDFWRTEHLKRGYKLVYSPHIANAELWRISGHLENFAENMYSPIDVDGTDFIIKPMNCPFHILMYKSQMRSYRDLPFRWAELGTVYRYEKSGVLHGMLRVRGFTQDDAHIFLREDQLEAELKEVIDLVFFMMKTFGFEEFRVMLSTRPEKFMGEPAAWDKATEALRKSLEFHKVKHEIDIGGGAFYGPKIDVKLVDALGREWQGPTIQVDFQEPKRFGMSYIGSDGGEHEPVMIHRAVLGSMERFVGTLIEHYAGKFPLWLAPVQVEVISVGEPQNEAVLAIKDKLVKEGIRASADITGNTLSYKIREAQMKKTPYMFVVGERETSENAVNVRRRDGQNLGSLKMDAALVLVKKEIDDKVNF